MPRGIEGLEALIEIRQFDANTPVILSSDKFEDMPYLLDAVKKSVSEHHFKYVSVLSKSAVRDSVDSGKFNDIPA
jgi:hypothetical protein